MYSLTFPVVSYDSEIFYITSKYSLKWQILSLHRDYINLFCEDIDKKYQNIITILKSDLSNLPQGPYRIITPSDTKKYNFQKLLSEKSKISVFKNSFCISDGKTNLTFKFLDTSVGYNTKFSFSFPDLSSHKEIKNCFIRINMLLQHILSHKKTLTQKVVNQTEVMLKEIKKFFVTHSPGCVVKNINENIGLGSGATPEYDDFFRGVLVSIMVFNKLDVLRTLYSAIKKLLPQIKTKTTMLSYFSIKHTCDKRVSLRVKEFIKQLFISRSNFYKLISVTDLILSEGGNSGWWFLYGMLKSSKIFIKKLNI